MASYITDVGNVLNSTSGIPDLKHSTSRKQDTTQLDMTDFLQLLVVQLQNQSIDNTMDTSDMLNQMVQMQMITALTNMTDASVMSYASSLVGKEVTVGDYSSGKLEEKVITVTGTGVSDGTQVIFAGNDVYKLSSVMAVGRLPEIQESEDSDKVEGAEGSSKPEDTDKPENVENPGGIGEVGGTDKPEGPDETAPIGGTEEPEENTGVLSDEKRAELIQLLRDHEIEVSDDITDDELVKAVQMLQESQEP